jgi:hypothetical protein
MPWKPVFATRQRVPWRPTPQARARRFGLLLLAAGLSLVPHTRAATAPQFTHFSQSLTGFTLGWTGPEPDTSYTVQYRDSTFLEGGPWLSAPAGERWPIAVSQWTDPATLPLRSRFYRVVAVPTAQRGKILSITPSSTLSKTYLTTVFAIANIPITPQYNVRPFKIVYETITPIGAKTKASGALLLPDNVGHSLPLVTYQHGTIAQTNKAPSSMDLNTEVSAGVAFASVGYAAAVPDYLGLGVSPGLHPYHHAASEATACVDFLRAVTTLCATNGYPLTNQLFLCGYSQGGHATMALLRELETFHSQEFTVTACAPMAGAYDLSTVTANDFLSDREQPNPYYFAYLLAAYQDVYQLGPSLAYWLQPPYDTTLPPLLHGNSSGGQINAAMPAKPIQILKPEHLQAFRTNLFHPLRIALQDNDLDHWVPRSPLHLFHCAADEDVLFLNSQVALDNFHALGAAQVELIDPVPTAGHGDCAYPSLLQAKAWFDSLR